VAPRSLLLAIETPELRVRVAKAVSPVGLPVRECSPGRLFGSEPFSAAVIYIETNDDVAALMQLVYEIHERARARQGSLPPPLIIGFLESATISHNPSIGMWLIRGAAAAAILASDDPDLDTWVFRIARRLAADPPGSR